MDGFPRFDLNGRVAMVTGVARGLGRAISMALAHAGADVVLGLRDLNAHRDLPSENRSKWDGVLCRCRWMLRIWTRSRAVDDAVAHFGRLDVLVNNAGVAPENLAENVIESDYDLTIAVNLKGQRGCTHFHRHAGNRGSVG